MSCAANNECLVRTCRAGHLEQLCSRHVYQKAKVALMHPQHGQEDLASHAHATHLLSSASCRLGHVTGMPAAGVICDKWHDAMVIKVSTLGMMSAASYLILKSTQKFQRQFLNSSKILIS